MSHILNCFEILSADELSAAYRLVDVDGPFDQALGDGELAESNLQQLGKQVAIAEQIPVATVAGGDSPVLAIPAGHSLKRVQSGSGCGNRSWGGARDQPNGRNQP